MELSISDLLSGTLKTFQEAVLCSHILGKSIAVDLCHSRVPGVTSEEGKGSLLQGCEVYVLNHVGGLLGPEACPF